MSTTTATKPSTPAQPEAPEPAQAAGVADRLRRGDPVPVRAVPMDPAEPDSGDPRFRHRLAAGRHHRRMPDVGGDGARPERRGRLRRSARPRLRRVLGNRRLHRRLVDGRAVQLDLDHPRAGAAGAGRPTGDAHLVLAGLRDRRLYVRASRHPDRCADAAAAWRLPGAGHPRLRRGHHPVLPQQQRHRRVQPGRRRRRHLDHRPGRHRTVRADTRRAEGVDQLHRGQRLQDPGDGRAGRHLPVRLVADPGGPARPSVAGHPRGRAGGQHDGRPAGPREAVRVRRRRVLRRGRRRRQRLRGDRRGVAVRASTSASR